MQSKRILAVIVVVVVWMACGGETPVAPVEEEGSAGVTLAETEAVAGELMASTESTGGMITACYGPGDGKMYLIKQDGLRTHRTDTHWTPLTETRPMRCM
jgi:hypothetical protein